MKIRTDFVTNSSSSSFIIAFKGIENFVKDPNDPETKIMIESIYGAITRGGDVYSDEEEIKKLMEEYEWDEDDEMGAAMLDIAKRGYCFAEVSVDYGDEGGYFFIESLGKDSSSPFFVFYDSN